MSKTEHAIPFSLRQPRFDQGTFAGRFRHFLNVVDPRYLFTSKKTLDHSLSILDQFERLNPDWKKGSENSIPEGVTHRELWEAKQVKSSIFHPDDGKKIFMPFRMSGFVPFNLPIIAGMLVPGQSRAMITFWQWINQTQNAGVNFFNAPKVKGEGMDTKAFARGYVGAVTSSIGIALGLTSLVDRATFLSPGAQTVLHRMVPFPAVSLGGVANVCLMRWGELKTGIRVTDEHGETVGMSQVAAKKALTKTAISRAILPFPVIAVPGSIMSFLESGTRLFQRYPRSRMPVNFMAIALSFGLMLPVTISLFPQNAKISRKELESSIVERMGEHQEYLTYNKGL